MKKVVTGSLAAIALLGLSGAAQAEAGLGVGVKGSTLGLGVELTKSLVPTLNGRIGFNKYTFSTSGTESDIEYDIDLEWQTTAAMLDWHPFDGSFRLTLGYVFNGNQISMDAKPTSAVTNTYTIDGVDYTLDSLSGDITFTNGTYLGLGWGNAGDGEGFGLSFEVGALYQGAPDLDLSARGTSSVVDDPVFQDHLAQEEKDAEDAMESYQWYPVVGLGITYSF